MDRNLDELSLLVPHDRGNLQEAAHVLRRNAIDIQNWTFGKHHFLMEDLVLNLVNYERLPFDKLKVTNFAFCWNALVALAVKLLSDIPLDLLQNLKLKDMQTEPLSPNPAAYPHH